MQYFNQKEHPDIPLRNKLDEGGADSTVAKTGCGLCSLCMIVDELTVQTLSLEECIRLYDATGAGHRLGTDMKILAPVVAERYHLEYTTTNDTEELAEWLRRGGRAIIHVGGDREGQVGLFSHIGHYIVAVSCDGDELCILDPSYLPGKFDEEGRRGKVRTEKAPFLYCSMAVALADAMNRTPHFHLFRRK